MLELKNLMSKCRLCLNNDSQQSAKIEELDNRKFIDIIQEYTGLVVAEYDTFSMGICNECLSELLLMVKFIIKIQSSNEKLRHIFDVKNLEKTFISENNEDEENLPLSKICSNTKIETNNMTTDSFFNDDINNESVRLNPGALIKKQIKKGKSIKVDDDMLKTEVFECVMCGIISKTLSEFSNHKESHFSLLKQFKCLYCNEYFNKIKHLNEHMKINHSNEILQTNNSVFITDSGISKQTSAKVKHKNNTNVEKIKSSSNAEYMYKIITNDAPGVKKELILCLVCNRVLLNKSVFMIHYRKHTGEKPFLCIDCGKCFTQIGTLNDHTISKHGHINSKQTEIYQNDIKAQNIDIKYSEENEILSKIKTISQRCYVTDKNQDNGDIENIGNCDIIQQFNQNNIEKAFDNGSIELDTQSALSDQEIIMKSVPTIFELKKDECISTELKENKFSNQPIDVTEQIHLKQDVLIKEDTLNKESNKDDTNTETNKLRGSQQKCRKKIPIAFQCKSCPKTFFKRGHLQTHERTHSDEKTIECLYCPQKFRSYSVRVVHIRVHHTKEKPYICHICAKAVASMVELRSHMTKHSEERPFKCNACDTAVKSYGNLKKHMLRKHSNEKQHICDVCGRGFALRYNLTEHMKHKHSESSGYCTICNKNCSDYEAHMRTHTGEKPFKCTSCYKTFSQPRGLLIHSRISH